MCVSYLAEYQKLERFIVHDGRVVNSSHLSQYRLSVSKYCYAVTYQQGGEESEKTIQIRANSATVLYNLVTDRLSFIVAAARQPMFQNANSLDNVPRAKGMDMHDEILRAFHSFSDQKYRRYKEYCGFGTTTATTTTATTGCESHSAAMYTTVLVYRQSIPELLKLTLELHYELLNILHIKMTDIHASPPTSADLPLFHGIVSIREVLDRMKFMLEVLVEVVHESQLQLVEDMTTDFLLTAG